MTEPTLDGALEGVKIADVGDLPRYRAAVEVGRQLEWGYYFPYLLTRNRPGRAVLLFEDAGSMCVFLWHSQNTKPRLDLFVAPTPMSVPVLRRALERANDYNRDKSAYVMRIDAMHVDAVSAAGLSVQQQRSQYLFRPDAYGDLGGKAYFTLRRNVSRVSRLPDVEVLPYSPSHAPACHELVGRWKDAYPGDEYGTTGGTLTSKRTIDLATSFSNEVLTGEVVLVDGRLVSFAFGGEIRAGVAVSFERKSDPAVPGLSYFQFHRLMQRFREYELVNDGTDVGRPGLRQFKESLRPLRMLEAFRATQPGRTTTR